MNDDDWVGPAQVSLERTRQPDQQAPASPFLEAPVRRIASGPPAPPPSAGNASLDPFASPRAQEASKRSLSHAEQSFLKDRASWAWKAPLAAIVIDRLFQLIPPPDLGLPWPAWWIAVAIAAAVISLLLLARGLYALVRGFVDCRRCGFRPLAGHLIVGLILNLPLITLLVLAVPAVMERFR